jgi:hypothetical protein
MNKPRNNKLFLTLDDYQKYSQDSNLFLIYCHSHQVTDIYLYIHLSSTNSLKRNIDTKTRTELNINLVEFSLININTHLLSRFNYNVKFAENVNIKNYIANFFKVVISKESKNLASQFKTIQTVIDFHTENFKITSFKYQIK